MPKPLKKGHIASKDLADWFGISYTSYRRTKEKYLEKLDDYCDFEEVYGGVNITEVYVDTYNRNYSIERDKEYLESLNKTKTNIITLSGVVRDHDGDIRDKKIVAKRSAYYKKSRDHLFGTPEDAKWSDGGLMGRCKRVWAVKIGPNDYRYPTEEEYQYLTELCHRREPDEALMDFLFSIYEGGQELSQEEYIQFKNSRFMEAILRPFYIKTGYWLVSATQHDITKPKTNITPAE